LSTVHRPDSETATGDQRLPAAAPLMAFASGSFYGHARRLRRPGPNMVFVVP
jgi:hypothetical protein